MCFFWKLHFKYRNIFIRKRHRTTTTATTTRNTNQYQSSLWIYESIAKWITQLLFGWFLYQVSARFPITMWFSFFFWFHLLFDSIWNVLLQWVEIRFFFLVRNQSNFCFTIKSLAFFLSNLLAIIFVLFHLIWLFSVRLNQSDLFVELISHWLADLLPSLSLHFFFHLHSLNWCFCFFQTKRTKFFFSFPISSSPFFFSRKVFRFNRRTSLQRGFLYFNCKYR